MRYEVRYFEEPKGYWERYHNPPKRRASFPIPKAEWQAREYEALMGRPPPETPEEAAWQFEYNPRTKASKQAFSAFTS